MSAAAANHSLSINGERSNTIGVAPLIRSLLMIIIAAVKEEQLVI